jgi:hypothetical protein
VRGHPHPDDGEDRVDAPLRSIFEHAVRGFKRRCPISEGGLLTSTGSTDLLWRLRTRLARHRK